jgi:tetratricopeptide (TPR) repeat protein
VERAFADAGVDGLLFQSAATALDAYAREFVRMHTEACEATRVRGEQTEGVLELRMSCLDRRLKELGGLTSVFASADHSVAEKSVEAAARLSSMRVCGDVAALKAPVPPPADAATRARVATLRGTLAEGKALLDAAQYPAGLAKIDAVLTAAWKIDYDPLRAEALELKGTLLELAGQSKEALAPLADAIDAAYAGHDDLVVARTATEMARVESYWLGRHEEGHRWARLAHAAIVRLGGSDELEAERERTDSGIYMTEGMGAEAVPVAERALALANKVWGPESIKTAQAHGTLGAAYHARGDFAPAMAEHRRHLELLEKLLGSDHPQLGIPINNLGIVADSEGKFEEAVGYYRRSLALVERTLGPSHPNVAITAANLGVSLRALGRYAEALEACRRAMAIYDRESPADFSDAIDPLLGIAESLEGLHRPKEALAPFERALRIAVKTETPGATTAEVRFGLARVLWETGGDHARARTLAAQARQGLLKESGASSRNDAEMVSAWLAAHR